MKKKYVIIGLLAASLASFGQRHDSLFARKKLSKTDVQVLLSYYTQDNNHSAVTGGVGTEDLQVYTTQIACRQDRDSTSSYYINAGVDLISSASTDNIDYEMSSASRYDFRGYGKIGYEHHFKTPAVTLGMNSSISIESDYRSLGLGITLDHANKDESRHMSLLIQSYFDDLRWYDDGQWDILVYPVELRAVDWFDIHKRNSYNVSAGIYQVINKRIAVGFYPGIAYQKGLLSTPFHRVYFSEGMTRVENLPQERLKIPLGLQLNTFLGTKCILRAYYRFYWDDFDVQSNTISAEVAIKVSRTWTVTPFVRTYFQRAASYFKPYAEHRSDQRYFTSDYDLSKFYSIKNGVAIRYAPFLKGKKWMFRDVEMRYANYHRSDGLTSHMVTLLFGFEFDRNEPEKNFD